MALPEATRIQVLAPVIRGKKVSTPRSSRTARKSGYVRCRVDGVLYELTEDIPVEKNKKHNIEIVVDRLVIKEDIHRRPHRQRGDRRRPGRRPGGHQHCGRRPGHPLSQNYACEDCGISIEELSPPHVLLQQPLWRLPGLYRSGSQLKVDPERVIPNKNLSILEGAITASGWNNIKSDGISRMYFDALAKKYRFKLDTPMKDLSPGGDGRHPLRHQGGGAHPPL